MLLALLVAVSSVLLGAAWSFVPTTSRAVLGYMRTFATLAAVAVVVMHLLPEALSELGPLSLLLFLFGWFAPALAHFIGQRGTSGRSQHAVLEAGYWGLIVHHVADGIGLGTYTRLPSESGSHLDVIVALAAHTVPLIAVVSLAYKTTFGARSAILRSVGLALAGVFGIALSSLVSASTVERFAPVIGAVAGGLLLHVVTHDLTEDAARTPLSRTVDLLVAALGVGVSLLGVWHTNEPATREFVRVLRELAEHAALVILVALLASAFSLRAADRSSKWGRALLPAAPLGAESVLLSIALFGFVSAGLRLALTAAVVAFSGTTPAPHSHDPAPTPHWRARISETLQASGPWLSLGLLGGALLLSFPLRHHPEMGRTLTDLLIVAVVANLAPVAAPAAVLIATGLAGLGLSAGAVLLFATLAPLCNSLGLSLKLKPRLFATAACLAVAALAIAVGLLPSAPLDGALSEGDLGPRSALVLAVLLLLGIWQRGARLWLSTIVRPPPHEHEHAHDVHGPHPQ